MSEDLLSALYVWGALHESSYSLVKYDFYSAHFTDEEGRLWGVKKCPGSEAI